MSHPKPLVQFHFLQGLSYKEIWDYQKLLHKSLLQNKKKDSRNALINPHKSKIGHFIFAHHQPVYTLGKSGSMDHLLESTSSLENKNIEFFKVNRGGDITFHGPGQITGYLILDLDDYYHDLHRYVRDIEEAIILFLKEYGLNGIRLPEFTGVWFKDKLGERKVCAIGVHMSRWVSLHGFALNINTDLQYFEGIVPCGIQEDDKSVTSLSKELNQSIRIEDVFSKLQNAFTEVYNFNLIEI